MELEIDIILKNESGNEIYTDKPISLRMDRKVSRKEFERDWNTTIRNEIKESILSLIKKSKEEEDASLPNILIP